MNKSPDFIILGAMKSATSSLYEQLVSQPGIYMTTPKEPNFFSDDKQFKQGIDWYINLFSDALDSDLLGEASTHYSKLPTYPKTIQRMKDAGINAKMIYVMRHPVDRLVSHYIHEWTQGIMNKSVEESILDFPELQSYSLYAMQLEPYIDVFGKKSILPVFFDSLKCRPQYELERICNFIGYTGKPEWKNDLKPSNVSRERHRKIPLNDMLLESTIATWLRRNLIPKNIRNAVKDRLRMKKRPEIPDSLLQQLQMTFDEDLLLLSSWLGVELSCDNFSEVTKSTDIDWV